MSFVGGIVDFVKVKVFGTRKKMCMCDMRAMYRWGLWSKCRLCYQIFAWVPVLFILSVIAWSYYAFVYVVCFLVINDVWLRLLYLFLYHAALVPFLVSYYQVVFRSPGEVPTGFRLSADACERMHQLGSLGEQNRFLNEVARGLPVATRSFDDNVRFCDVCAHVKPDRSHHCSVCGTCVLKMDHHCPWVNNCVGENNQKFFVLFTLYIALISVHALFLCIHHFIYCVSDEWRGPGCNAFSPPATVIFLLFLLFEALLFSIFTMIMFGSQMSAIWNDETGIEALKKEKGSWHRRSKWKSIQAVFGRKFGFGWFSPFTQVVTGAKESSFYSV
jgi:hypothetical protein